MRGQTIKGRPDGRAVLSQELDGIKWHDHGATVASTDLGNRDTTGFDYGTKPVSVFDYGTKSTTGAGAHNHPISGRTQFGQAGDVVAMSNTGSDRTNWGLLVASATTLTPSALARMITLWGSGRMLTLSTLVRTVTA